MKLDMLAIKKSIIFIIRALFEMQIIDPDQLSHKKLLKQCLAKAYFYLYAIYS